MGKYFDLRSKKFCDFGQKKTADFTGFWKNEKKKKKKHLAKRKIWVDPARKTGFFPMALSTQKYIFAGEVIT